MKTAPTAGDEAAAGSTAVASGLSVSGLVLALATWSVLAPPPPKISLRLRVPMLLRASAGACPESACTSPASAAVRNASRDPCTSRITYSRRCSSFGRAKCRVRSILSSSAESTLTGGILDKITSEIQAEFSRSPASRANMQLLVALAGAAPSLPPSAPSVDLGGPRALITPSASSRTRIRRDRCWQQLRITPFKKTVALSPIACRSPPHTTMLPTSLPTTRESIIRRLTMLFPLPEGPTISTLGSGKVRAAATLIASTMLQNCARASALKSTPSKRACWSGLLHRNNANSDHEGRARDTVATKEFVDKRRMAARTSWKHSNRTSMSVAPRRK
mmetsp:Transcript_22181/g.48091  ORF Transcript_22181/g.48091 Transcript_22181/m.48091 type:complete len:333 (+) Transcript_22181:236-1234(+)